MTTRFTRFIEARLSPEGEFGLHVSVGILLLALATAVFGILAHAVLSQQGIVALDLQLAQYLRRHAAQPWTSCMLAVSFLHSTAAVLALVAMLAWRLWQRRARYWLLALLLAVPGGMLLNVVLKQVFQRSRPVLDEPLVTLLTYSFPSGHTVAATLLYGWLACWLVMEYRRQALLRVALPACVLMVLLVASSRMYLGAHYLSDVLAAMAEGVAWLAICMTATATLRRRRLKASAAAGDR